MRRLVFALALLGLCTVAPEPARAQSAYEHWQYDENEGPGENLSVDATADRSAQLTPGRYYIYATVDTWWERGDSAITVTKQATAGTGKTSHFLPAGVFWFFVIKQSQKTTKAYVSVIRDATDGIIYIRRAAD